MKLRAGQILKSNYMPYRKYLVTKVDYIRKEAVMVLFENKTIIGTVPFYLIKSQLNVVSSLLENAI